MKKIILTLVLLLTVSFAFATNEVEKILTFEVEETLSVEFTKVDLEIISISMDTNNNRFENSIITEKDCFGYAIGRYEAYIAINGDVDDAYGAMLMNAFYAIC